MAEDWGSLFALIKRIQQSYPDLAYLLDDDEVGPLLLRSVNGGMDSNEFVYKLHQTNWWKTTTGPARAWDAFVNQDPATARAKIGQQRQTINAQANGMGVDLTLQGRHWIAVTALREGWSDDQITRAIARQATWQGGDDLPGGTLGATFDQYRSTARDYGIKMSGRDTFKAARKTVAGGMTTDGFEADLRHRAMERFSGNDAIVTALKNGANLREYFAPIQNEIASQLEVAPDQVDLINDRRYQDLISHVDDQGRVRPMSIPEATKWIRSSDQWWRTDRAQKEASSMVENIARTFGQVA